MEYKKKKYVSHFRSPIFDETNIKIFHKPIFSKKAYECFKQYGTKAFTDTKTVPKECLLTKEHPNGRTKSAKILFDKIVNEEIKGMIQSAISAMIWIPYFLMSKRVKATFVH